jgi:hypothetical protein
LPGREGIIGISDLAYFKGIGFSMPISFENEYFVQSNDPMLRESFADDGIHTFNSDDTLEELVDEELEDALLNGKSNQADMIDSGRWKGEYLNIDLHGDDDSDITDIMGFSLDSGNLYAFLPGLFYSSTHEESFDGFLYEVTQKKLHGMLLSTFRPEDVRSFDISHGFILDDRKEMLPVKMTMDAIGGFSADITETIRADLKSGRKSHVAKKATFSSEIDVAETMAGSIKIQDLKKAYVTGAYLGERLLALLLDIKNKGLQPRNRILVKNQKYPDGEIVDVRYRSWDKILTLGVKAGVQCPNEMDVGLEIERLCFSKMLGENAEVDIETSVRDLYGFIWQRLGDTPSSEEIVEHIFSEVVE